MTLRPPPIIVAFLRLFCFLIMYQKCHVFQQICDRRPFVKSVPFHALIFHQIVSISFWDKSIWYHMKNYWSLAWLELLSGMKGKKGTFSWEEEELAHKWFNRFLIGSFLICVDYLWERVWQLSDNSQSPRPNSIQNYFPTFGSSVMIESGSHLFSISRKWTPSR